jgi:hypothetical protein
LTRVLTYTCSCRTIAYGLSTSDGTYVIRCTYQAVPLWKPNLTGRQALWSGGLRRTAWNDPADIGHQRRMCEGAARHSDGLSTSFP